MPVIDGNEIVTSPLFVIAAVIAIALVVTALALRRRARRVSAYVRRDCVLDAPERHFFTKLADAVGDDALVLAKTRMADVLEPRPRLGRGRRRRALEAIIGERLDFVVCRHDDGRPLLAIDLGELPEGRGPRRHERFVEAVCDGAGLARLRLADAQSCTSAELRQRLEPHLRAPEDVLGTAMAGGGRREPRLDLPED